MWGNDNYTPRELTAEQRLQICSQCPFMKRTPVDLPPIISVELIQISDITNIPFAPKAREILKKVKGLFTDFNSVGL